MDLEGILNRFEDTEDAEFKEHSLLISKGIRENKITILDLIERLGILLTDKSVSKRELGVLILNDVLKSIPIDSLSPKELEVLAEFYSTKLKDHHQVLPGAFAGILTLIGFEHFPGDRISVLLNAIFQNVPCQQQQQADRYTIFQIFETSLKLFKQEVLSMKLDFVYGVLQAIQEERNPKNLLFLFKWLKQFLADCPLHHLAEDMFDVLACYFPVDFRAPPNENSVTREDLADALCPCLCANPDFGESCISLALEKLDSSLEIAKLDSLKLLREGCLTFDSSVYLENVSKIWPLIQKEILTTTSPQTKSESLKSLQTIVSKITDNSTLVHLKNIVDTIKGNLLPDSKLFNVSAEMLVCIAAGSQISCGFIMKEVVPTLINVYKMSAYTDHKSVIVNTLVHLIRAHLNFKKSLEDEEVAELRDIPFLCLELLNVDGDGSKKIGLDCLVVLVPYLTLQMRGTLYTNLRNIMFTLVNENTSQSFMQCLKTIATYYPDEVKNQIFNIQPQLSMLEPFLKAKAHLITLDDFKDYVIGDYLEGIRKIDYSGITVRNLKYLVVQQQKNDQLLKYLIDKNVLNVVIQLVLDNNIKDTSILRDVSVIMTTLIAPQSYEYQIEVLKKYYRVIFEHVVTEESSFVLGYGLLAALRRDVPIDDEVCHGVFTLAIKSDNRFVIDFAVELLGNLVNKNGDDETLITFLEIALSQYDCDAAFSEKHAKLVYFITKGLILRNHSESDKWLHLLVKLIGRYPSCAKDGIKIIMDEDCEAFSETFHCRKVVLYKQRTFNIMVDKIIEDHKKVDNEESKKFLLSGLAYLCEYVPLQVILFKFKKITPYLILCLEQNETPDALCAVTILLRKVCTQDSGHLKPNFNEFITRILNLTTYKLMDVRIECLKCLTLFVTVYPDSDLFQHKSQVLKKLSECVDDKKRLVRREAMEARALWSMLGELV